MQIVIAVSNDISTDQRVIRTARTLYNLHAQITIIGRSRGERSILTDPWFNPVRMKLLFNSGPLFYAEFNLRLLIRLMFLKADLLVSNDLDTLPAVFLASKLRKITLVYDSHEYFTEVPELAYRRKVRKVWEWIESRILPKIRYASTVSFSIARAYYVKYGIDMKVIRNLPFRKGSSLPPAQNLRQGSEKIILYQGSLNMGRGLELAIESIQFIRDAKLCIIGKGDIENKLKHLSVQLGLEDRIVFPGRISPEELPEYTAQADLGISLEEDLGLSYRYSLPNKVFDYIQAGVPVLVSDLPEVRALVEKYNVGMISKTRNAGELAALITGMLENEEQRLKWKAGLEIAAEELCWEKEEQKLIALYQGAMGIQVSISDPVS
jgi:glycosyltransferase involved in cell wall biosynthesis